MSKRLFVAIPLSPELVKGFSGYQGQFPDFQHVRWVPPENFHITVYFIGWVEEKDLSDLTERLRKAFILAESFCLQFEKIIWAPPDKSPRMIWGLFKRSVEFEKLVNKVDKVVRPFLSREILRRSSGQATKESIPHVTLVRFDPSAKWKKISIQQPKIDNKILKVDQINLMESQLLKTGPIYSEVISFRLK